MVRNIIAGTVSRFFLTKTTSPRSFNRANEAFKYNSPSGAQSGLHGATFIATMRHCVHTGVLYIRYTDVALFPPELMNPCRSVAAPTSLSESINALNTLQHLLVANIQLGMQMQFTSYALL